MQLSTMYPLAALMTIVTWSAHSIAATYSEASISSPISNQFVSNPDGDLAEVSAGGTQTRAYSNGLGGFAIKPTTASGYASAELATGELKASASLAFGTDAASSQPGAPGLRSVSSVAEAAMADGFSLYSGGTPFLWSSGTEVSFSMDVSGTASLFGLPPLFADSTVALLSLEIHRNGEFLESANWCLGPNLGFIGGCGGGFWQQVNLDGDGRASVSHTFTPGGDFDWTLRLRTEATLDLAHQNVATGIDFSHTIKTRFIAPEGVTVVSESGLFPDTVPVTAVPEPETYALLLAGLGLVGFAARRRTAAA